MPNYNYRPNDYMRRGQYQRFVNNTSIMDECKSCPEENPNNSCAIDALSNLPIAMAYVPWQEFKNLYPAEKALHKGTIFEELDKPFLGKGGCCK